MAGSRRAAAALAFLLAALLAAAPAGAADLCEGCWELGGRGAWLSPSDSSGADPSLGLGVAGLFRFRPYWGLEFAYDRHPGSIPDGPDETLGFLTVSGILTFRSERDQRTRPYAFLGAGFGFDRISSSEVSVSTPTRTITARSEPSGDHGLAYSLGAGMLTSLSDRYWLRLEARWLQWSSFGVSQDALQVSAGLSYRFRP